MVGTVVYWELRCAGRRRRQHVARWLLAGWLVLLLQGMAFDFSRYHHPFNVGRFIELLLILQFMLLAILTPALTAAALSDETTRGILPQLVTTDLWPSDILLGKLLARLAEVVLFLLVALPPLAFFGVFAGLHPPIMLMVLWLGVPPLLALGTAGLLASVLARHTREAIVGVYLGLAVAGVAAWLLWPGLARALLPLEVLRPAIERGQVQDSAVRLLLYSLGWLTLAAACLLLALARFPRVWQRPFEQSASSRTVARREYEVGDKPMVWKEQRVHGLALAHWPPWLLMLVIALLSMAGSAVVLARAHLRVGKAPAVSLFFPVDARSAEVGFLVLAGLGMLAATLAVGARASAAVSGEREAGTWDALLLTPLEPHQLLRGKLQGMLRAALPGGIAFSVPLLVLSILGGAAACFWTLLMLLLTPLAMFYLGSAGLYASVASPNSTRALIWTLLYGYLGAAVLYGLASFNLIALLTGIVYMFLSGLLEHYGMALNLRLPGHAGQLAAAVLIASCLAMALLFYLAGHSFLKLAERRLTERERVRQEEPRRRQARRPRGGPG